MKGILDFLNRHEWIKKLYPAVLLPFANIVQMTIQKAYFPIDTIWYGKQELSNRTNGIFKDFIIFIDEFDSTKEIIQSLIISKTINKERLQLFKTITYIHNSLKNILENSVLPKDFYGDNKEEMRKLIEDYYDDLYDKYNRYHLGSIIKFEQDVNKDQFLFRDKQTIDIKRNSNLVLIYDESSNVNYIHLKNKTNKSSGTSEEQINLEEICEYVAKNLIHSLF